MKVSVQNVCPACPNGTVRTPKSCLREGRMRMRMNTQRAETEGLDLKMMRTMAAEQQHQSLSRYVISV